MVGLLLALHSPVNVPMVTASGNTGTLCKAAHLMLDVKLQVTIGQLYMKKGGNFFFPPHLFLQVLYLTGQHVLEFDQNIHLTKQKCRGNKNMRFSFGTQIRQPNGAALKTQSTMR